MDQKVKNGDTLSLIFKRAGYNDEDVQNVISQSHDGESLERIFPGQTIAFQADDSGELVGVRYIKSPLETITYMRTDTGFESHVETRSPEHREAWTTGVITSSLFLAGQEAGLSQSMILEMANIFGGVVDFALDPRRGDTMQLVYEELYVDGKKFSDGEIIAASFTNQGETFNAFRYTDCQRRYKLLQRGRGKYAQDLPHGPTRFHPRQFRFQHAPHAPHLQDHPPPSGN